MEGDEKEMKSTAIVYKKRISKSQVRLFWFYTDYYLFNVKCPTRFSSISCNTITYQ